MIKEVRLNHGYTAGERKLLQDALIVHLDSFGVVTLPQRAVRKLAEYILTHYVSREEIEGMNDEIIKAEKLNDERWEALNEIHCLVHDTIGKGEPKTKELPF